MITDEEFLRISVYMKQHYGIDLSQKKLIINGRLENYIKSGRWRSFNEYMDAIERDPTGELEKTLVNHLTTNYTYFMREFEHFKYFKNVVLPWLKVKREKKKDLHIWCGAASTGEEPYMIAMVLAEFFGLDYKNWDTKILATDISNKALKQALAGVYNQEQLKSVPEQWKRRFFKSSGGMCKVSDALKQKVVFRQFNLMDPFPFKNKMDVVFLRNVMIYFDEKTKMELVNKVYDSLEPGGYFFIGMTETIDRKNTKFQIIQPSIFRKKERND